MLVVTTTLLGTLKTRYKHFRSKKSWLILSEVCEEFLVPSYLKMLDQLRIENTVKHILYNSSFVTRNGPGTALLKKPPPPLYINFIVNKDGFVWFEATIVGSHDVVTNHRISSFSTRELFFPSPTLLTAKYPTVCEASNSVRCFYLTFFFPKPQYRGNQCQRQREHYQSNFHASKSWSFLEERGQALKICNSTETSTFLVHRNIVLMSL